MGSPCSSVVFLQIKHDDVTRQELLLSPRHLLGLPVEDGVQSVLDLTVGSLGVEVHGPGVVHQREVNVAQLVVHLE